MAGNSPNNLRLGKLIQDSLYTLSRQGVGLVVGLITSVILARVLGVQQRGVYAIALLFPTLLILFINSGIQTAIIYSVAREQESVKQKIPQITGISFWVSIVAIFVGLGVLWLGRETLFQNVPAQLLLLSLVLSPITICLNNIVAVFRGIEDFRISNQIEVIPQFIVFALVLILVGIFRWGVWGGMIAVMSGRFVAVLIAVRLLRDELAGTEWFRLRVEGEYLRSIVNYGLRVQLGTVATWLNYRVDVFLLNLMSGETAVGLYDLAVEQVESLWMLSQSVGSVLFSRSASLEGQDEQRRTLTALVTRHIFWFGIVSGLVTYILAEWAVVFLYGEEYRASVQAIRILLPGIVMLGAARIISNDIAGRGKPEINGLYSVFATILNIGLNLFLIPRYDFFGAAIATSVSYGLIFMLNTMTFRRITHASWGEMLFFQGSDVDQWRESWTKIRQRR